MKSLFVPILSIGLLAGTAQAEEKKVLELPADCGALLGQEVQGKVIDIIHCPKGNFENSLGNRDALLVNYGEFTQELGNEVFPDLLPNQHVKIEENGITTIIGKEVDTLGREFFYTSLPTKVQFILSQGYNCYTSEESETGSKLEVCYTDTPNYSGNITTESENGTVVFPVSEMGQITFTDGTKIDFGFQGVATYSPENGIRL